jgi:hypothetical protein
MVLCAMVSSFVDPVDVEAAVAIPKDNRTPERWSGERRKRIEGKGELVGKQ